LSGTADVVFPSYSNSVSARNVNLTSLKTDSSKIEFEIPIDSEKITFRGQAQSETIFGRFEYAAVNGDFGLARVVYPRPEALEKYYGIYQVAPERSAVEAGYFSRGNAASD